MSYTQIPKIIHYCWFGGKPKPRLARKCIASWEKHFPGWEIREWNESNFDVNAIPFTKDAYRCGKYAFVSDYARFDILYRYGGLYLDTDVEVIAPFDDVVDNGPFMGKEGLYNVAPGLGMGAVPGMDFYAEVLRQYKEKPFLDEDGNILPGTVVSFTTEILKGQGYKGDPDCIEDVAGIRIYPNDWFCPLDDATGTLKKTANTHSIHWYAKSWISGYGPVRTFVTRWLHRLFGTDSLTWLKKYIRI